MVYSIDSGQLHSTVASVLDGHFTLLATPKCLRSLLQLSGNFTNGLSWAPSETLILPHGARLQNLSIITSVWGLHCTRSFPFTSGLCWSLTLPSLVWFPSWAASMMDGLSHLWKKVGCWSAGNSWQKYFPQCCSQPTHNWLFSPCCQEMQITQNIKWSLQNLYGNLIISPEVVFKPCLNLCCSCYFKFPQKLINLWPLNSFSGQ